MDQNELLSVSQVSKLLGVAEETVRRWIRGQDLRAVKKGNEFFVRRWDLESFVRMGKSPNIEYPNLLLHACLDISEANNGALLFDKSYFEVEKQWERINSDKSNLENSIRELHETLNDNRTTLSNWVNYTDQAKSLKEKYEASLKKPNLKQNLPDWSYYQRTLFLDIHFYFVAAENLNKAIKLLLKDVKDSNLDKLLGNYEQIFNSFNEVRSVLEHSNNKITQPEYAMDFGNIDDKGYSFGGKHYDFYIQKLRELRDKLTDFFLLKKLPITYPKYRKALKEELESLMGETMTDEEFLPFAELFVESMRSNVKTQKTYNEGRFEDFINKEEAHLAFTPKAVIELVNIIIQRHGNDAWENSGKFKRMRELAAAIRLLLIIKVLSGLELLIESYDKKGEPDIRLISKDKMFSTKPEKFPLLEIMTIYQHDLNDLEEEEIIEKVAILIEDKKFNVDQSNTDLLIHFDFTAKGFNNEKLSERVRNSKKKNPYSNIWITGWTSPDHRNYLGAKIFPNLINIPMSYEDKMKLLY